MHPLLKNWKVRVLVASLIIAVGIILWKGIALGIDFSGGTVLIFQFDHSLTPDDLQKSVQILEKRLNWTGLSSVIVRAWGDRHVIVELGTADPVEVEQIKESVLKQGKFETVVDGNVVLTGDDILAVDNPRITPLSQGYRWIVPFKLSPEGVRRFYTGVHGKCTLSPDGTWKCKYTFMYIDRPVGKILLIPKDVAEEENVLTTVQTLDAVRTASPDQLIPMEEFLTNAGVKWFIVDENFDPNTLLEYNTEVILHPELNHLVPFLQEHNISYRIVEAPKGVSWIWQATNLRSVVRLTESITNVSPDRGSPNLMIEGWAPNRKEAEARTEELRIILQSGALPAAITLVSEMRIPPTYGKYVFYTFLLAMLASMIAVSLYIAFRYKEWRIVGPIILTIFSETLLIFGFAALINWRLDIPSMVGMIAATGTGVDDQIVITDEILRGKGREEEEKKTKGILRKIRKAFFIVFAAASALVMSMLPVLFSGVPALVGFALTTIVGVLVGVFITRPAFAEILRYVLQK